MEKPMYAVVGVDQIGERYRNEHTTLSAAQADFTLAKVSDRWARLYTWINGAYGRKRILSEHYARIVGEAECTD